MGRGALVLLLGLVLHLAGSASALYDPNGPVALLGSRSFGAVTRSKVPVVVVSCIPCLEAGRPLPAPVALYKPIARSIDPAAPRRAASSLQLQPPLTAAARTARPAGVLRPLVRPLQGPGPGLLQGRSQAGGAAALPGFDGGSASSLAGRCARE